MTEKTESNQQIHDNLQTGLKDGELRLHNKFHPTRWKCGYAKYHFHRKFEYDVLIQCRKYMINKSLPSSHIK